MSAPADYLGERYGPGALGLVKREFHPNETIMDQTLKVPDGLCYWITKVHFDIEPVQVWIPGNTWTKRPASSKRLTCTRGSIRGR